MKKSRVSPILSRSDFNKQFALEIDCKFYGLSRLEVLKISDLFWHKFAKQVVCQKAYDKHRPKNCKRIEMHISSHRVCLYFR